MLVVARTHADTSLREWTRASGTFLRNTKGRTGGTATRPYAVIRAPRTPLHRGPRSRPPGKGVGYATVVLGATSLGSHITPKIRRIGQRVATVQGIRRFRRPFFLHMKENKVRHHGRKMGSNCIVILPMRDRCGDRSFFVVLGGGVGRVGSRDRFFNPCPLG